MTILNYEIHQDLANNKVMFEKLKDFAQAQGWTINIFNQNKEWLHQGGGVYAFDTGTEDFMQLSSSGFGAQDLQYRLRMFGTGSVPTHEWLYTRAYFGGTALDFNSSTHPYAQTTGVGTLWGRFDANSFPSIVIPTTWFFGNEKFICVVCKVDAIFCKIYCFGTMDLYDPAETEGGFMHYNASSGATGSTHYWYNHNQAPPFDTTASLFIRWDGSDQGSRAWSMTSTTYSNVNFAAYGVMVLRNNNYTGRRPIFKQTYFVLDSADGRYLPIARNFVGRINTEGLQIGEKVKYGAEEWITFPYGRVNERFNGVAFQIAG